MSNSSFFHGKRGEYLVALQFVLFFAFILTPEWNPLASTAILEATAGVRWALLGVLGVSAMLLGGLGVLHIRDYLTPLPYPVDHSQLVRHGVYAWVRHPLYSSQLFAALAWTLFSLSLPHLGILVLGFFFFDYKASKEEGWLLERHPEYAEYKTLVKKLVPWIY